MQQRGRRVSLDNYMEKNPENTIRVARPSRYGNPFKIPPYSLDESLTNYESWLVKKLKEDPHFIDPLNGKNLACYCKIDNKCHVDVLLKYC